MIFFYWYIILALVALIAWSGVLLYFEEERSKFQKTVRYVDEAIVCERCLSKGSRSQREGSTGLYRGDAKFFFPTLP